MTPFFCQVSTSEVAVLQLIIGDNATCANPGESSITENVTVGATGGDGLWGTTVVAGAEFPAGTHSLKLCVLGGVGISVDSVQFDLVSSLILQWGWTRLPMGWRELGTGDGADFVVINVPTRVRCLL